MKREKTNLIRSNRLIYLFTKYGPLVIGIGLILENYQYFKTGNFDNKSLFIFSIFLLIEILLLKVVRSAVLTINEIQIGNNSLIKWADLKSIDRVGYYYVGIIKKPLGVIIFPIDEFGSWGWYFSDSSMVQLIDIVKRKYNI